jgi:hypothetical protein
MGRPMLVQIAAAQRWPVRRSSGGVSARYGRMRAVESAAERARGKGTYRVFESLTWHRLGSQRQRHITGRLLLGGFHSAKDARLRS